MRGLADLARSLVEILRDALPPWVVLVVAGLVVALVLPFYWKGQRRSLARRRIAALTGVPRAEAGRLEAEAFSLVGTDPDGLVGVAEEALRHGREALARQAIARLAGTGRRPDHVARLERLLEGPPPRLPEEEALGVARLLDAGLVEAARRRLDRARARWPELPEWKSLAGRLAEATRDQADPSQDRPGAREPDREPAPPPRPDDPPGRA
ncbi:MAG: hypothetical protein JXB39_11690 [Deltaproteobacteria bacterium]|nr:hypothetical protein [Deltaproteobacteria bacterium]